MENKDLKKFSRFLVSIGYDKKEVAKTQYELQYELNDLFKGCNMLLNGKKEIEIVEF